MRKLFLTLALAFASMLTFAQPNSYSIQLVNECFVPSKNVEQFIYQHSHVNVGELSHQVLQFEEIPTEADRLRLTEAGITLGDYIPNYAYEALFQADYDETILRDLKVRSVMEYDRRFKLSPELFAKKYPSHAMSGQMIKVHLSFFSLQELNVDRLKIQEIGKITHEVYAENRLEVEVSISRLEELVSISGIKLIEPITPNPIPENTVKNTGGRSNWVNTGINGLNFDGSGVTLMVQEAGSVDPASLIEWQGRFTERSTAAVAGHKTGVTTHMGGAGNLVPTDRSIATGSDIVSTNSNSTYVSDFASISLRSANHSYGYGVGTSAWGMGTTWDRDLRDSLGPMHTWSAGNVGWATSTYGPYAGISGLANITGGIKQAKNTITVGAIDVLNSRTGFSCKGPAYDGRIKPDIMIEGGGGTSYAAPKITGVIGQLVQIYRSQNGGNEPHLALLKAILLNTCDDMENPGPDYRTGYGRANIRRAYEVLTQNKYLEGVINNGGNNNHSIAVPSGVSELKVLVHWADYPASSSLPAKALVNDLDLTLTDPASTVYLPWILDPTAVVDSLNKVAVRGVDTLNNIEQVTLLNPVPGNYTVNIAGTLIPQGPQPYFLTYEFIYDTVIVTYPIGKEHFVPGETEVIQWDAYGAVGTFDLDYSTDGGITWTAITTGVNDSLRAFAWTVPNTTTGQASVRVTRGAKSSTSIESFNIMPLVTGAEILWICGDSVMLTWDPHPGATSYRVTQLGNKYMDSLGVTTNTFYLVTGVSATQSEWFSVQAYGANLALSRRVNAIEAPPGDSNCVSLDIGLTALLTDGYYPYCIGGEIPITVELSNGGSSVTAGADIKYQINGGTIFTTNFNGIIPVGGATELVLDDSLTLSLSADTVLIWVEMPGDGRSSNDTVTRIIGSYPSGSITPNYTQDFDLFTNCSTTAACFTACALQQNWFNVPNLPGAPGDSIDWRTDLNGTGTGSTGPSGDHTSGTGKYLYLEGSGNGGAGCRNHEAQLHSPCVDLTGVPLAQLSYWYHAFGNSIGSLHVDVLSNGVWQNDVVPPVIGQQGNAWIKDSVDLSQFSGEMIVIRFRGITGNGFRADLALDDINILAIPDTIPPTAVCQNITVALDTSGNATLSAAAVDGGSTDNVGIANSTLSPNTFNCSNLGPNTVTLVVTDASGNPDSCTAIVTVIDSVQACNQAPVAVCQNVSVAADANCQGIAAAADFDNGSTDPDGDPITFAVSPMGPYALGTTNVTLTVTDSLGASDQCMATITVIDSTAPSITCPANISVAADSNCQANVNYTASATDNCTASPGISFSQVSGSSFGLGTTVVTVIATDSAGNADTCIFTVTVMDSTPPVPVCPANISMVTDSSCQAVVTYTGSATDNCAISSTIAFSPVSGSMFSQGTTTVTMTASDNTGNTNSCSFTVTLIDSIPPVITCPANVMLANDPGQCSAIHTFTNPGLSDNCTTDSIIQIAGLPSGSSFPRGMTTNTFVGFDEAGQSDTCSFTVTVQDTEDPVIANCPADITIQTDSTNCTLPVNWTAPAANDNCGISSFTSSNNPGSTFSVGISTVSYIALDSAGNSDTCTFDITIVADPLSLTLVPSVYNCGHAVSCNGLSDGSVTANVTGGCLPYSFLWNTGDTTASISGLNAGTYLVTITDGNGDMTTDSVVLTEPLALSVTGTTQDNCIGDSTGAIDLTVSGGCAPYSFMWSNGAMVEDLMGQTAGTYSVSIVDTNGCIDSASFVISFLPPVMVNLGADTTICPSDTFTLDAGGSFITYAWNTSESSQFIMVSDSGFYSVIVTDSNGCQGRDTISIQQSSALTLTLPSDTTICFGDQFTVCADSGLTGYLWNTGDTTQCITITATGQYWISASNGNGCAGTSDTMQVDTTSAPQPMISQSGNTMCVQPTGTSYQWLMNGIPVPGGVDSCLTVTTNGPFSVQVTYANGCTSESDPFLFTGLDEGMLPGITVYPNPARDKLYIHTARPINSWATIQLTNMLGQVVITYQLNELRDEVTLDLGKLSNGAYQLSIISEAGQYKQRIIIE